MRQSLLRRATCLEFCELFKKLAPEKMLAKLQEERLRLYCFRHRTDQDYFAKNNPGYQGCEEIGCSGHHHRSLHWQVAVGRLFQCVARILRVGFSHLYPETEPEGRESQMQPGVQRQQRPDPGDREVHRVDGV